MYNHSVFHIVFYGSMENKNAFKGWRKCCIKYISLYIIIDNDKNKEFSYKVDSYDEAVRRIEWTRIFISSKKELLTKEWKIDISE